jgi:hypothetical protein
MTEEEKKKADDLISNLEKSVGQILSRDKTLNPVLTSMIHNLGALRSVLGLVREH